MIDLDVERDLRRRLACWTRAALQQAADDVTANPIVRRHVRTELWARGHSLPRPEPVEAIPPGHA